MFKVKLNERSKSSWSTKISSLNILFFSLRYTETALGSARGSPACPPCVVIHGVKHQQKAPLHFSLCHASPYAMHATKKDVSDVPHVVLSPPPETVAFTNTYTQSSTAGTLCPHPHASVRQGRRKTRQASATSRTSLTGTRPTSSAGSKAERVGTS